MLKLTELEAIAKTYIEDNSQLSNLEVVMLALLTTQYVDDLKDETASDLAQLKVMYLLALEEEKK